MMDDNGNEVSEDLARFKAAQELRDLLKRTIHEVLDERNSIDHETHASQHAFLTELLKRKESRRQMWAKAKDTAIGVATVAILSGFAWIGKLVFAAITKGQS